MSEEVDSVQPSDSPRSHVAYDRSDLEHGLQRFDVPRGIRLDNVSSRLSL